MAGAGDNGPHRTGARTALIADFLHRSGFGTAHLHYLSGDASFRRYGRLTGGPVPALVMDAPPDKENVGPWIAVGDHLRRLGFSAPEIIAADVANGLLVIEDFGDETFTRALAAGADEAAIYDVAVDVLAALHGLSRDTAVPEWLPPYDDERLLAEASLLVDWYLPAVTGAEVSGETAEEYLSLWQEVLPLVREIPETLVLRDYHVDNLMRIPGRRGVAACGILDFQDAVAGPVAYDLISLLEDARRDLGDGIAARAFSRYRDKVAISDLDRFEAAAAVLAAIRNAKIIGIFTRLWKRDGKPGYLSHIPRVWRLLEGDLRHPALGNMAKWFDGAVPQDKRTIPGPGKAAP